MAIARVLLKDSPIVVYDEATSSLDSITENVRILPHFRLCLHLRTFVLWRCRESWRRWSERRRRGRHLWSLTDCRPFKTQTVSSFWKVVVFRSKARTGIWSPTHSHSTTSSGINNSKLPSPRKTIMTTLDARVWFRKLDFSCLMHIYKLQTSLLNNFAWCWCEIISSRWCRVPVGVGAINGAGGQVLNRMQTKMTCIMIVLNS